MKLSRLGGQLKVEPDTVSPGGEIEVECRGTDKVIYKVDGESDWKELPLTDGKAKLTAPPGAAGITFMDWRQPPASVHVQILDTSRTTQ